MFFGDLPEALFRLCLRDGVDKSSVARSQGTLLREGVPAVVGQRCLNHRVGEIQSCADSPSEGNMFDTGGDGLADNIECPLSGQLRTIGVSWRSGINWGDGQPRGHP